MKRVGDVVLASVGLVLTAPVMLIIAAVVKAQDRGPGIFRQTCVGRGGELFTLLKFRSMVTDAENRKADLLTFSDGHGRVVQVAKRPADHPFRPLPSHLFSR
jgi:lipopolysaccharide/colanic/teichoic acid biosynthesis glycosyltransferase